MRVLGVHDGHNASACLIEDGHIRQCIQEERLTNRKNYFGFPLKSVEKILGLEKIGVEGLDFVAMASYHTPRLVERTTDSYKKQGSILRSILIETAIKSPFYSLYRNRLKKERLGNLKALGVREHSIIFVDHHLCHAASAYFGSPWRDEKVLVLTSDGSGDGLCATVYLGERGELTKIAETARGNSIGDIYSRVTFMLGLVPLEHEWKVMGLAPYAPANGAERSYAILRRLLDVSDKGLTFIRRTPEPTQLLYPRLRRELEHHRFDWISAGAQKLTEELLREWVRKAVESTGVHRLALGGGVFMNVKANKVIMEMDEVEDLFVFPSCGDESSSIGAAYMVYAQKRSEANLEVDLSPLRDLYLGPAFTDQDVERSLSKLSARGVGFTATRVPDIEARAAELLAQGKVVARCKGRMEFGARALGNRSILADPSDYGCVRTINVMVKNRDFWMPFAPVMTERRESDYIVNPKKVRAPYMMLSFDTTEKRRELIAAVHQADLTARPQVLEREWNPDYYRILEEFERRTGRGVLLNTSFNLHGYPIVYGPDEALWVFENSGLEHLALGDYLVTKTGSASAA